MYKFLLSFSSVFSLELLHLQEIEVITKIICQILITFLTVYLLIKKYKK